MEALEILLGLALIGAVLWDVFQSVVVPRPSPSHYRIARIVVSRTWRLTRWYATRPRAGGPREGMLGMFAPAAVLLLLGTWIAILLLGDGLLVYGLRDQMKPVPANLGEAIYAAGTSLFTLGFGDFEPVGGAARFVMLASAAAGLGVVALVITYLFSLYGAFQRREVLVVTLDSRAGAPPSGVALLETYSHYGMVEELPALFGAWEVWAAEVLDSHVAYPILAYFRSSHDHESWVSSLGAVLDAATLVLTTIEGVPRGQAKMMFAMGEHLVEDVAQLFGFPELGGPGVERSEFDQACARLEEAGFTITPPENAWPVFSAGRARYATRLNLLAGFWVSPPSLWIGDRSPNRHFFEQHVQLQAGLAPTAIEILPADGSLLAPPVLAQPELDPPEAPAQDRDEVPTAAV